jgi:hypothetical protein
MLCSRSEIVLVVGFKLGKVTLLAFELAGIVGQHLVDAAWAGNTLMQPRRRALIIKILERTT